MNTNILCKGNIQNRNLQGNTHKENKLLRKMKILCEETLEKKKFSVGGTFVRWKIIMKEKILLKGEENSLWMRMLTREEYSEVEYIL